MSENVSWLSNGNCSDSESVSMFINATDPAYFNYQQINMIILFTLGACGILMNSSMICALVYWKTHQKTALGLLFLQLFIANLCVAVFCLIADGIWYLTVQWNAGDFLCRVVKFAQMFSLYATTFILTSISIETCVTLTFPLTKSKRQVTFFRVKLFSGISWSLASICSIPQAIIFHLERAPICEEFHQCVTHGFYSHPAQEMAYAIATSFLKCILPLAVIIFCYVIIAVKISKEAQMVLRTDENGLISRSACQGTRIYQKTRRISLWMSLVTSVAFVICWAPYYSTMIAHLFKQYVAYELEGVIFCFGTSFCVLNPLVFGAFVLYKQKTIKSQRISQSDGADLTTGKYVSVARMDTSV